MYVCEEGGVYWGGGHNQAESGAKGPTASLLTTPASTSVVEERRRPYHPLLHRLKVAVGKFPSWYTRRP